MKRVLIALLLLAACAKNEAKNEPTNEPTNGPTNVRVVEVPFKAAVPFVTGGGTLSFMDEEAKAFRVAAYHDGKWSPVRTIATDEAMLINRADFPSIAWNGKELVASWSTRREHGAVVHVAKSSDGGVTWSAPATPHPDVISQFGFVSLAGDQFVYLDGRALPGGEEGAGDMQLRAGDGTALDTRVCDCCQTTITMTSEGPVAAYRDRSDQEIRDISIVRKTASGWTVPKTLHADGWKIAGCPVNGPQLDANGRRVVVAWFTAANNDPRVNVAFSEDAGETFSAPIRVDPGKATGRADVVLFKDGSAAVTWVSGGALHARRVQPNGTLGTPVDLGESAGFPRTALWDENVAVVWSRPDGVQLRVIERL